MRLLRPIHALLAVVLLAIAAPLGAAAAPLTPPYTEIDYDLTGSELDVELCIPSCTTSTFAAGPGSMTLQFGGFDNLAPVRLTSFHIDLLVDILGQTTDVTMTMLGDANGQYNPGLIMVDWTGPLRDVQTLGTSICAVGAGCDILGGIPAGVEIPIDETRDIEFSDIQYVFGVGGELHPTMSTTLPDDFAEVTVTLKIFGTETARREVAPEPGAALLLGLGLLGLVQRRRHRA